MAWNMNSMMRFSFSFQHNVSECLKAIFMTLKSVSIQGRMWNTIFHQFEQNFQEKPHNARPTTDCNIVSNISNIFESWFQQWVDTFGWHKMFSRSEYTNHWRWAKMKSIFHLDMEMLHVEAQFGISRWFRALQASIELFRRLTRNFFKIRQWQFFKTWFIIAFFNKRKLDFLFLRPRWQWICNPFYFWWFYSNLLSY